MRTASTHSEVDPSEQSPEQHEDASEAPEPQLDEEHWKEIDLGNGVKMTKEAYLKEW